MKKHFLVIGLVFLLLFSSLSVVDGTDVDKNNIENLNQSMVNDNGLPDLIIEDIYAVKKPYIGKTYFNLLIRNIGYNESKGTVRIDTYIYDDYEHPSLPDHMNFGTFYIGNESFIISPNETIDTGVFLEYYNIRIDIHFKILINPYYTIKESNYSNNLYYEMFTLSRCKFKSNSNQNILPIGQSSTKPINQQISLKFNQLLQMIIKKQLESSRLYRNSIFLVYHRLVSSKRTI